MKPTNERREGPIEAHPWPTQLVARVVEPGPSPRLHGYDVEGDLARHYRFAEVFALAIGGELAGDAEARAIEVAMIFLAPAEIAEPPAHAASIARMYGATPSAVTGVAAIALAEQARSIVASHAELFAFLEGESDSFPARHRAPDHAESVARLVESVGALPGLDRVASERPSRMAAILATLWLAGLRAPAQLESAFVLARLPAAIAEGLATKPGSFESYPMNTPPFAYEEP